LNVVARVLAARQIVEPAAHRAVAAHQSVEFHRLELADGADAVLLQRRREDLADTPNQRDRLVGEEGYRLGLADDGKAARLVEVRRDLGQKLRIGQADRNGDTDGALDVAREASEHLRRRQAVQPLRSGQVQKGLVDRNRLDQRRQRLHHAADFAPDADIFFHVRRHDDGIGAGFQRLEHRHCRTHASNACDIAGG